MRDGVRLATDVYLPDGPGPFPAVLVRLPYDKNGRYCWMPFMATHFIARGYAFVPQDVRGKFRSEGEPLAFVNEVGDGYDTIDWIAQQPWSNGAVGMWGDSYYGFTQWAAVASRHPALKAIVPRVTIADIDCWLEGVTPLYGAHYLGEYWSDHNSHEWTPDWSHRPLAEVFDDGLRGDRPSLGLVRLRARALARRRARRRSSPEAHPFDVLRIPTLHGVGWFDNITPPHMLDYEALMREPGDGAVPVPARRSDRPRELPARARADPRSRTITPARRGPGAHAAALHRAGARLLRRVPGRQGRPSAVPRVRWHLADAGWQESPSWPPPGASELRLYLADAERAAATRAADRSWPSRASGARRRGCTTRTTSCPRRSSTRSPPSTSIRTSARSRRGPTC